MSKIVKASEFKAKCLALMDEVARTGESVIVTKKGEPLVELVPHKSKAKKDAFGILKDELVITGDIMSPIDAEWNAMSDPTRYPRRNLVRYE